jgi:hypothetical protein
VSDAPKTPLPTASWAVIAPIAVTDGGNGTLGGPTGIPAGFAGVLVLLSMIGVGGLLIVFRRRRPQDGEPRPFGAPGLVPAGASVGASAAIEAVMPPPAAPGPAPKAKRTPRGKAPMAAAIAAATATPDAHDAAMDPTPAVVDATSWEVSDDAPLAATSAAYAATKAALAEPSAARTFAQPPGKGVERATIRSRLVRFNAEPDDLRSAELDRLDRGDEVEILGSYEGFLNVRVPDGTEGWIHRAALV